MSGWRGNLAMSGTKTRTLGGVIHTFTLNATVDYAVYAPGSFDLSFPNADPSDGTDYVYAYRFAKWLAGKGRGRLDPRPPSFTIVRHGGKGFAT